MGKGKKPTMRVADYYMSVHYGVCIGPVDAITGIYIQEKTVWEGYAATETAITLDKADLFGGLQKEGGIKGVAYWLPGGVNQVLPEGLCNRFGRTAATTPGFRGLSSLFFVERVGAPGETTTVSTTVCPVSGVDGAPYFSYGAGDYVILGDGTTTEVDDDGCYVVTSTVALPPAGGFYWGSNNPYVPPAWVRAFRVSRNLPGGEAYAVITTGDHPPDANPANMIYECLTDVDWGMGAPIGIIDTSSFAACSQALYAEGFGLSMMWTQSAEIESFVSEILDHISATLFVNPRTGKLTLKLIRDDYDAATLRVLTPDNARLTSFQRKLWGDVINEIVVTWTNPTNEQEETVTLQDLAAISMQGGIVSDNRNYYGVRNGDLAAKLASRDLRVAATPLAACEVECDRRAWDLLPGEVIAVSWPEYGMDGVAFRVGNVDYGRPDASIIRASLVEDVFSLPVQSYVSPAGTEWVDTSQAPAPMAYTHLFTLPYPLQVSLGVTVAAYPEAVTGVLATAGGSDTTSVYELNTPGTLATGAATWLNLGRRTMVGHAFLPTPIPREALTVLGILSGQTGPVLPAVGNLVFIGNAVDGQSEIAMITAVGSGGSVTLARGVLDTIPRPWPANTAIWLIDGYFDATDTTDRAAGETATYKLQPHTSVGVLPLASAPAVSFVVTARPHLPLRPANVRVGGSYFATVTYADGAVPSTVSVTWANRNRTTEDSQVRRWTDATVTPETGQTTTIQILDADDSRAVVTAHTGLTGTSFSVPIASFGTATHTIVRVSAVRDGLESLQAFEIGVQMPVLPGYGYDYGYDYGAP